MAYYVNTRTYIEEPSLLQEVLEMSRKSSRIFRAQPDLIEMKSLLSEDETHLATWLVWENQQAHLACMESKDFADVTPRWTKLMEEGKIRFELDTYQDLG